MGEGGFCFVVGIEFSGVGGAGGGGFFGDGVLEGCGGAEDGGEFECCCHCGWELVGVTVVWVVVAGWV